MLPKKIRNILLHLINKFIKYIYGKEKKKNLAHKIILKTHGTCTSRWISVCILHIQRASECVHQSCRRDICWWFVLLLSSTAHHNYITYEVWMISLHQKPSVIRTQNSICRSVYFNEKITTTFTWNAEQISTNVLEQKSNQLFNL